ncbi:MAG: terminase TerL endonuclease subunit [Gaiellaceae bacterium]
MAKLSARAFGRFSALIGRPLEPFQRKIAAAAFGPERELCAVLPRGNAKSSLAAALAVHHLVTVERPSVVVGAGSREQARVVFELAREIAIHPALAGQVTVRHLELRVPGGNLRVVASDGGLAHGPTPSLSVIDELWAHKSGGLYEAQRTALVKRPDARLLVLSTAARSADTPLGRLRARALAGLVERHGVFTDARAPGLRLLEWSLTAEDDLEDDRLVARCNPASWISAAVLAEQRLALPRSVFLQFHACVTGAGEGAWLPPGAWSACRADYTVDDHEEVVLAVDVGGSRASTALVAVTPDLRVAAVQVWQGDDAVLRVPDAIRELARRYTVREVAYDAWRFQSEALRLERDDGLTMVAFPQSHARMTVASEGLHAAIVEQRLRHRGDPELDRQVALAVAKRTGRGWRLDKSTHDAQIDATVALAIAVDRAQHEAEPARLLGWL